jgi:hypothetical protein
VAVDTVLIIAAPDGPCIHMVWSISYSAVNASCPSDEPDNANLKRIDPTLVM